MNPRSFESLNESRQDTFDSSNVSSTSASSSTNRSKNAFNDTVITLANGTQYTLVHRLSIEELESLAAFKPGLKIKDLLNNSKQHLTDKLTATNDINPSQKCFRIVIKQGNFRVVRLARNQQGEWVAQAKIGINSQNLKSITREMVYQWQTSEAPMVEKLRDRSYALVAKDSITLNNTRNQPQYYQFSPLAALGDLDAMYSMIVFHIKPSEIAKKDLALKMLQTVAHAHRDGLTHRDIKPGNFVVDFDENYHYSVKLIDFSSSSHYNHENNEKIVCKGRSDNFYEPPYRLFFHRPQSNEASILPDQLATALNNLSLDSNHTDDESILHDEWATAFTLLSIYLGHAYVSSALCKPLYNAYREYAQKNDNGYDANAMKGILERIIDCFLNKNTLTTSLPEWVRNIASALLSIAPLTERKRLAGLLDEYLDQATLTNQEQTQLTQMNIKIIEKINQENASLFRSLRERRNPDNTSQDSRSSANLRTADNRAHASAASKEDDGGNYFDDQGHDVTTKVTKPAVLPNTKKRLTHTHFHLSKQTLDDKTSPRNQQQDNQPSKRRSNI